MIGRAWSPLVAIAALASACQWVKVPAGACFEDEPCASPPVTSRYPELGVCDDWACLQAAPQALAPQPPDFTQRDEPVWGLEATQPGCGLAWLGGVALPDGRVLAVPHCATRMLLIDPVARSVAPYGPELPPGQPFEDGGTDWAGRYAGGVLGCDGLVYLLPYRATSVLRVSVPPGDAEPSLQAFELGYSPELTGGVIAQPCAEGFAIAGAGKGGVVGLWPRQGALEQKPTVFSAASVFNLAGVTRLGARDLATSRVRDGRFSLALWVIDGADGGVRTHAGTILVSGTSTRGIAATLAGEAITFESPGQFRVVRVDGGLEPRLGPVGGSGGAWPANRGDGWVYFASRSLVAVSESGLSEVTVLGDITGDAGLGSFQLGGLVATPSGVLVGIPGWGPATTVSFFIPDGGVRAAPSVLLSPWFNKL